MPGKSGNRTSAVSALRRISFVRFARLAFTPPKGAYAPITFLLIWSLNRYGTELKQP